jgi:hypothetical protein
MFEISDNKIFIIPSPNDKPVKICFEDKPMKFSTTVRCPNDREIYDRLSCELRMMKYAYIVADRITPQQYRSERGKIKKLRSEVLRFIEKRNVRTYKECIDYISKEQEYLTFTRIMSRPSMMVLPTRYGIISFDK